MIRCLISTALLLILTLSTIAVHAKTNSFTCEIDLAYGLVVNDDQIRVMDKSRTILQINQQRQLFISGQWVELDAEQQQQLYKYAAGLHDTIPKMIVIATEGVDLVADTINQVYLGLMGSDHESYERLNKEMKDVKERVRDKFRHASDHYFIAPGSLESVDEFVGVDIDEELEQAISTSLGGILSAIGGINTDGNEANQERVDRLSRKLDGMSAQFEDDLAPRASTLKMKAHWYCDRLRSINANEERLRDSVPQFYPFDIITLTSGR